MRAVVTDIEGTTSSMAFVKEVLFPHSRARLPGFVREHAGRPEVAQILDDARALAGDPSLELEAVVKCLVGWIDEDRKAPPLKALQGLIWQEGYAAGDYRGHVYADVAPALRRWHAAGVRLFVYSSGSVAAQRLLFGHSTAGDLTPMLSGYFDTGVGGKTSPDSYRAITATLSVAAAEILFLSDVPAELDAARAAGMATTQLCREGLAPVGTHPAVDSFERLDEVLLE